MRFFLSALFVYIAFSTTSTRAEQISSKEQATQRDAFEETSKQFFLLADHMSDPVVYNDLESCKRLVEMLLQFGKIGDKRAIPILVRHLRDGPLNNEGRLLTFEQQHPGVVALTNFGMDAWEPLFNVCGKNSDSLNSQSLAYFLVKVLNKSSPQDFVKDRLTNEKEKTRKMVLEHTLIAIDDFIIIFKNRPK